MAFAGYPPLNTSIYPQQPIYQQQPIYPTLNIPPMNFNKREKGSSSGTTIIAIIILLVIIITVIGIGLFWYLKVKISPSPESPESPSDNKPDTPKPLGGSCVVPTDCANANLSVFNPGITCCNGTCQQKMQDHAKFWYCPNECVGSIFGQPGTCH